MANLIDQETGEIDRIAVLDHAKVRAAQEWRGPDYPPSYYRSALEWCEDRARSERLDWRRARGLPDDSPVTMVEMPTWGASGDSFHG